MTATDVLRALKTTKTFKKKAKTDKLPVILDDLSIPNEKPEVSTAVSEESKEPVELRKPVPKKIGQITGTGYHFRDASRQKLVDLIIQSCGRNSLRELTKTMPSKELIQLALRLENEVYRLCRCGKAYNDKLRSLIFNLSDEMNE